MESIPRPIPTPNPKSKTKTPGFGKLLSIPKKLLTKKYLTECKDEELSKKLIEKIPIKPKKGTYLVATSEEKELLMKKKKKYKKTC